MTELEPIWDEKHIYNRLLQDAFLYQERGQHEVNAILLVHAQRAMGNLQNQYLQSLRNREWAWQQEVASRDRKIAELSVRCTLLGKLIEGLQRPATDGAGE